MRKAVISLLTLCLVGVLFVGTPITASAGADRFSNEDISTFLASGQFDKAVEAAEYITDKDPQNGDAWLKMAAAYYQLKDYKASIKAYRKADELNYASQLARYNTACCYGLLGNKEKAEAWLERALDAGFSDAEQIKKDTDLALLRDDAQFAEYVKTAKVNAAPCEYNPECRQLDFWIGQWQVYNPQGTMVGTNRIEKSLNGCLLIENWSGVLGMNGKSMNYYHEPSGQWKQHWVSSKGKTTWYDGTFEDGKMVFIGDMVQPDGSVALNRMTLSPNPDGSVRQLIEQSTDGGKTWNVGFDGKYVKQEVASSE